MSSWCSSLVNLLVFFCIIFVHKPAISESNSKADKAKQRIEQLFLWKVSDRLQLSPKEESILSSELKKMTDEKVRLAAESEELVKRIEKNKADKNKAAQLLKEHISLQSKINLLQIKEVQTVEKLFGSQKASEYILVKREMMQKIRELLSERNHASAN